MKLGSVLASILALACVGSASAGDPLAFEFTSQGGPVLIPQIPLANSPTEGFTIIPLTIPGLPGNGRIDTLELVINDLTHTDSGDLDILLVHPTGGTNALEIMTDRGVQGVLNLADLVFSDNASQLPIEIGTITPGTYLPEGIQGFDVFQGLLGAGTWFLLLTDDAGGDTGSVASYTLRGTAVPEPMTLSLLAFGALAMARRRWTLSA